MHHCKGMATYAHYSWFLFSPSSQLYELFIYLFVAWFGGERAEVTAENHAPMLDGGMYGLKIYIPPYLIIVNSGQSGYWTERLKSSGFATLHEVRICRNMTNFVRIPRSLKLNMSMQVPYILKFPRNLMLLKKCIHFRKKIKGIIIKFWLNFQDCYCRPDKPK